MARVLVIDDESVQELFQMFLKQAGYDVITASDGGEGLQLYRQEHPDLVVTDIMMGPTSGLSVIRELRTEFPLAKIIAMTGYDSDVLKEAKVLGANWTMFKPFNPRDLLLAIRELLEKENGTRPSQG